MKCENMNMKLSTLKQENIVHVAYEQVVLASAAAGIPVQSPPSFMTQFS